MKKAGKVGFSNLFLLGLAIFIPGQVAHADVGAAFSKGSTQFTIYGGTGYAFNEDYFVIGVGGSYFLTNGFSIGLAAETWTGADPKISKLTPSLNYVFYQVSKVKPYIGAFYRHTYIENLPDLESVGGRAGVYISAGSRAFVGIGGVYESYLDCTETVYTSCDDTYPEISFTFTF